MPINKAVATGNRNNELYRETARSNWKKPLIAIMPDYSRNTVFILTPLIFRYHLPLITSIKYNSAEPYLCSEMLIFMVYGIFLYLFVFLCNAANKFLISASPETERKKIV
jgi:hypothetical protein